MQIKLEGRNMDIQFYGLSDLLEVVDLIAAAGMARQEHHVTFNKLKLKVVNLEYLYSVLFRIWQRLFENRNLSITRRKTCKLSKICKWHKKIKDHPRENLQNV